MSDETLDVVLGLNLLTHVYFNRFEHESDYTQRDCLWKEVAVNALDLGPFARLPLDKVGIGFGVLCWVYTCTALTFFLSL